MRRSCFGRNKKAIQALSTPTFFFSAKFSFCPVLREHTEEKSLTEAEFHKPSINTKGVLFCLAKIPLENP